MTGPNDEESPPGAPVWLMTFADVTALMLTFFVMMFAMSNVETERWDAIISLLSTSERPSVKDDPVPTATRNIATVKLESALPLDYLDRILAEKLSRDAVLADARVHRLDGRVVVSLPGGTLFAEGSADIVPQAREALFRLSGVIATIGNRVVIEGHTDPNPQSDKAYESKWSLTLARAVAVANALREAGYAKPVTVLGLADGRFGDLDTRLPEDRRLQLARRVDIVIHPDGAIE